MVRRPTIRTSSAMRSWPRWPSPLEEGFQTFEGDVLPAGDEFKPQLVLPGDPELALQAREDFEDDLGLELRREGPASAFGHGVTLLVGQY
jgi:hypothetical protein